MCPVFVLRVASEYSFTGQRVNTTFWFLLVSFYQLAGYLLLSNYFLQVIYAHLFVLFISLLAVLLQNSHITGQYEKFDKITDVGSILAFSPLRNGLILKNAHNFWFVFRHSSLAFASNIRELSIITPRSFTCSLCFICCPSMSRMNELSSLKTSFEISLDWHTFRYF